MRKRRKNTYADSSALFDAVSWEFYVNVGVLRNFTFSNRMYLVLILWLFTASPYLKLQNAYVI